MERERIQAARTVEFTYDWYREFLDEVRDAGYDFRRFSEDVRPGDVVLRHDVDLSIESALKMAMIEADAGVSSTYCVLLTSALYNPVERERREQLREISRLGHEVALHFSTHEYWDDEEPGDNGLRHAVEEERAILAGLVGESTETVSFHSPPEWVLNRDVDGLRSTYGPAYFDEMTYVADSGQRWRNDPPRPTEFGERAQVLAHPGLYSESDGDFDQRVERAVTGACRHANAKAQQEFVVGGS